MLRKENYLLTKAPNAFYQVKDGQKVRKIPVRLTSSTYLSHFLILLNVSCLVISYTRIIPCKKGRIKFKGNSFQVIDTDGLANIN